MNQYNDGKPGLFGISFDAVSMSGIIVEFLKSANIFHRNQYNVYLDLGYEIKPDKNNFFKKYAEEISLFPSWVTLIKVIPEPFEQYSKHLVELIFNQLIKNNCLYSIDENLIQQYSGYISETLVSLWHKLNIKIVFVENGTLPENIIFTKALYGAINQYGTERNLNRFVIWRDHDFMWSSESNDNKYGMRPYPNVPLLKKNQHIAHVVLHDADYNEVLDWNSEAEVAILENEFNSTILSIENDIDRLKQHSEFRQFYHIPDDAYLIGRFTRIIGKKRIDRDICLLYLLQKIFRKNHLEKEIYLCIAGDQNEDRVTYNYLYNMVTSLNLTNYVIFTGILKPIDIAYENDINNIRSLILASDICSFLTSFDYDSFGNPIAEAISLGKPYMSTTYERYQHVYANAGFEGILFKITRDHDCTIDKSFAEDVYEFILNKNKQVRMINHNISIMKYRRNHSDNLAQKISNLLRINLN